MLVKAIRRSCMGFLDGLLGNASEINISEIKNEYDKILGENECIERAYKLIRDMFIFTNKRLILVDKQGITGKKCDIILFNCSLTTWMIKI